MPARLAFSNDIDFSDWATYREVHRVLRDEFGIQAEDSFWLFDPSGSEMALFTSSVRHKGSKHDELLEAIAAGHLAVLHSAGNFSQSNTTVRCSRDMVAEGLAYLAEHARVPSVWTNHGDVGDVQNLGAAHPVYQLGDAPQSDVYLADLLKHYGVRFFWTDAGSRNDFVLQGRHVDARILSTARTRSGHTLTCFTRYRGALPCAPDAQTLDAQLTIANLEGLIQATGTTIVYQHWCVHRDASGRPMTAGRPVFPEASRDALARLVAHRERGAIDIVPLSTLLATLEREAA